MEYIVQQLESSMEGDFNPARCLLDALATIVWPPTLHKAQPQDTEPSQIIHTNAFSQVWLNANVCTQVTYTYMYMRLEHCEHQEII